MDSSGIRLTLTPTLRLHDAGVIEVASMVDPSQVIPPNQRNFVSSAYCNESALHLVILSLSFCLNLSFPSY